jgi:predicted transcriptional regulator
MPCIDDSGNLSDSGKALLSALSKEQLDVKTISSQIGVPLFKVRSSIRELVEAGLIQESNEKYSLTEEGKNFL